MENGILKLIKLCEKLHVVSSSVEPVAQYHFKLTNADIKINKT